MPELQSKRREPLRPPSPVERARRERRAALNALLIACARYGAAHSPREREQALVSTRAAREKYRTARLRMTQAECAEATQRTAKWLEQMHRRYARPGSRWSSEKSDGYGEAMRMMYDWIRVVLDRARLPDDSSGARKNDPDLPPVN